MEAAGIFGIEALDERAWGFSVTEAVNASGGTFAHEIGHNLGVGHDTYAPTSTGLYSYSHGYTSLSGRWYTNMANGDECYDAGLNCERILEFSDPSRGTGTSAANNAWTLRQTVGTVASYYHRTNPPPPPPPPPESLGKPQALEPRDSIAANPLVFKWREATGPVFNYDLIVQEHGSNP